MQGITSYKHLNKLLVKILEESKKPLTAREIDDHIFRNYKTNKIHINAIVIAKRLQFLPNVEKLEKRRGVYVYQYYE
jgi:hypothetical protein